MFNNDKVAIKGRGWTYGRKQRNWLSKEYASSTTVSTEGLMISCMIEAIEFRDVSTSNIPGAFKKTDCDKGDIYIKTGGSMVTLLGDINQAYFK